MVDRRSISQKRRAALFLEQDGKCADCPHKLQRGMFHADHRIPLADGGTDDDTNIKLICLDCHKSKTRIENKSRAHHKRIAAGGKTRKGNGFKGWRKMDGTIVWAESRR